MGAFPHQRFLGLPLALLQVYYEPMLKLDIMTESELGQIFGTLDSLIPLHEGKHSFDSSQGQGKHRSTAGLYSRNAG